MKSVRCLLLLQFYVLSLASKPRSVNLALETTFEFNNKQDVAIIERVRKFLDTIESAVDKKLAVRHGDDGAHYEFTDFLRDVITTIASYDDDSLKAVFRTLNDEVHNYRYRSSRFNEIMDNDNLRRRVVDVLRKTKEAPAQFLRDQLRKNLKALKRSVDKRNTSFLNFLNILYKRRSAETLRQTVENLKLYGKRSTDSGINLMNIIKTAVKALIYDKYSNLDENVRRDVKTWLETVARSSGMIGSKQSQKKQVEKKTDRVKQSRSPRMYTFVTLYPEEIHFEVKKSFQQRTLASPTPAWTERTVPNKNYFYLVKAPAAVKANGVGDGDKLNSSSSSLEDVWRSHRREATSALWLARHQKQNSASKVSKQISRIKEILDSNKSDKWLRRAGMVKNATDPAPESYLERIRRLETELNRMKAELKAKITTMTDRQAANKTDEYSDYEPDKEVYVKESNTTLAEVHDTTTTAVGLNLETTEAGAVFRSNNNTKRPEVQTEVSLRALDGYNLTFRAAMDSSVAENEREVERVEIKQTNATIPKAHVKINTLPTTVAVKVSDGGQAITKSEKLVVTVTEAYKNTTNLDN